MGPTGKGPQCSTIPTRDVGSDDQHRNSYFSATHSRVHAVIERLINVSGRHDEDEPTLATLAKRPTTNRDAAKIMRTRRRTRQLSFIWCHPSERTCRFA